MPDYRIVPHKSYDSKWRWYAFSTDILSGLIPTFKITKAGGYDTAYVTDRFACYASAIDSDDWTNFGVATIGATDIETTAASALPGSTLYFALHPMYPYARTLRKVSEWILETHVTDTPSSSSGVIGASTSRANGLNAKTIPALSYFGFRITDAGSGNTKNRAILASGNHPDETLGRFSLEGAIDYLLGGSAIAETLLDWFEFYVYPCVNPQGIYGGYYRSCPQTPTVDHNRQWNTTGDNEAIDAFKTAMATDTETNIDVSIDFHCARGANSGKHYAYVVDKTEAYHVAFETEMKALDAATFTLENSNVAGQLSYLWNASYTPVLNVTLEAGSHRDYTIANYNTFGENAMKSVYEMLMDGKFTNHPV